MTTALDTPTDRPTGTTRVPMDAMRKAALFGGLFYLITFASSIPAVFLLRPVLNDTNFIITSGANTEVIWGCVLDVVNALAVVGSAVALFTVVKRQSEAFALGFVTTRLVEAGVILIGVVSLLTIVTLRQPEATGADAHSLVMTGQALVAARDWTFLLGPNIMASLNALLLGTLMYKSGLVPRVIPTIGLIGAPLLLAVTIATIFGLTDHGSAWWAVAAPIFIWELSLGLYLTIKGFKPSHITTGMVTAPTA